MELKLSGKRALVTGASRGIGQAISLGLASEGASVVAVSREPSPDVSPTICGTEGSLQGVALDLLPEQSAERLLEVLPEGHQEFDIIVNNLGGTLEVTDPFCSIEDWRAVMRFNFEVAVEINRYFLPAMQKKGWGRVVNIASHAAFELNGPATYAAAKAALAAYTRCVGRLLAKDGIVMTTVLPGVVKTDGGYWERLEQEDPERVENYVSSRCPLGRLGKPAEIADVVVFLCSGLSSFAPGAVWPLDGGQLRGYQF